MNDLCEELAQQDRIVSMADLEYFLRKPWVSHKIPASTLEDAAVIYKAVRLPEYMCSRFVFKCPIDRITHVANYDRAMKVVHAY